VIADHVEPLAIAHLTGCLPHRIEAMFQEPFVGIQQEVLLAPQHPGQCLPLHIGHVLADVSGGHRPIERIRIAAARFDNLAELAAKRIAGAAVAQP